MAARTFEEAFEEICRKEGPLKERLEDLSRITRELSVPFAEAYDDLVARLSASDAGSGAPEVGDPMPPFLLPDNEGHLVSLDQLLVEGPAVLSFNRGHWCEYCIIELTAFRRALNMFASRGAAVVSIMPEAREFVAKASANQHNAFRVLSDMDNAYALEVGLAIWVGERVRKVYSDHGLHIETYQRNQSWFLPIPATFVVGRDGRIVARYVDPDFRRRMDIAEIIVAIERASTAAKS